MNDTILEPAPSTTETRASPTAHRSLARPPAADEVADSIRRDLTMIRTLAGAFEYQQARELCAALLAEQQPLICRQPDLLHEMFITLIVIRGFQQLSRLAIAASGADIRVAVRGGARLPPSLECREEYGRNVFIFHVGTETSPIANSTAQEWTSMILAAASDSDAVPNHAALESPQA
jgi:hypothetical protein